MGEREMLWNKKITKLVPQVCSKLTSTAAIKWGQHHLLGLHLSLYH